ncbi:MAG: signal peptide peptidase SppA [Treponema sp.]|nr:signal peptide peptidase SppA [Treponema sp.]MCL2272891.1 signal peptide peptidase SppA [Treponema sp.]
MSVSCKYLMFGVYCLVSLPLFSQSYYLELNLNNPGGGNIFAIQKPQFEVLNVIEKAANDNKIKGLILNIGSISRGREYLWELRKALVQFKASGKKICVFICYADLDVYTLASIADRIVMDELGNLNILGYSTGRGYAKQALDKLGIGVRELRYLEYKSAAEMYTRDTMSEADRRQYNDYLDDIFNLTRNTLTGARGWTIDEFNTILNREFFFSAKNALSRKLVDSVGRKDAVLETVREMEGEEKIQYALYGDLSSSLTGSEIIYTPPKAGGLFKRPPIIAVVNAYGQTDMTRGMAALELSKTIRSLADNRRVRAIVIRMDSPGGSAEAADYLDETVRYAKQKKPVVVSMGSMAASGGYWASMNASHIMATPYTITGSIGVIASWFYDNGLNSKLGLNIETIRRGDHSDLMNGILVPYRNLTDLEEERYKGLILDLYGSFTEKVAAGRNMELDKVEAFAQGRILSGTRALEAGLIDSIGSFSDALHTARQLAEIPEKTSISYRVYPEPKFLDRILERIPLASVLFKNRGNEAADTASFIAELLLPDADIRYRMERNGQILPILPLEFTLK